MATWKKVLVSGSSAALTSLTADTTVDVGLNQKISTTVADTKLSGSFSGSFQGDGRGLTGVVAAFPNSAVTDLTSTDQFYVKTSAGNQSITLDSLLNDIAGTNLAADPNPNSITLKVIADPSFGNVTATTVAAAGDSAGNFIGFIGTGSWAVSASQALTASYALNSSGGTLTISGSDNTSGSISLASKTLIFSGSSNIVTTVSSSGHIGINLADNISIAGDLTIVGGTDGTASISTAASTTAATIFNANPVISINMGGNQTTTTMQNLTLLGNLRVDGSTTTVTTENLTVADRFILLGSSSFSGNIDGGIVIQSSSSLNGKVTGSGYALFMNGTDADGDHRPRWGVTSSLSELADSATPDEYMVTAKKSSGTPPTVPNYGGLNNGYGNMFISSDNNGEIWIYV